MSTSTYPTKSLHVPVWPNGHDPEFPLGLAKSVLIVREGDLPRHPTIALSAKASSQINLSTESSPGPFLPLSVRHDGRTFL